MEIVVRTGAIQVAGSTPRRLRAVLRAWFEWEAVVWCLTLATLAAYAFAAAGVCRLVTVVRALSREGNQHD